jgi:hypothetical protein
MPGGLEPPEAQSIRSMLHVVRILAIIIGVLLIIGGIAYAAAVAWAASTCGSIGGGSFCGAAYGPAVGIAILIAIFGIVDFVIYVQMKEIESMVNQRQYEAAKSKTLVWMILGFILGGVLLGVLLLVAYIKFDPLISWQRGQGGAAPVFGAPAMAPPPAAMGATPPTGARFCSSCGSAVPSASQFCAKCGAKLG